MDVEAVYRVDAAAAGEALELGEGGAVLAVLPRPLPRDVLAAAVPAHAAARRLGLRELQQPPVLPLVGGVQLARAGQLEVVLHRPQPPESLPTLVTHVLYIMVQRRALSPVLPRVHEASSTFLAELLTTRP